MLIHLMLFFKPTMYAHTHISISLPWRNGPFIPFTKVRKNRQGPEVEEFLSAWVDLWAERQLLGGFTAVYVRYWGKKWGFTWNKVVKTTIKLLFQAFLA